MLSPARAVSPAESTASTHSNLLSAGAHRRVELQSPADFTHLLTIATTNAREKIIKHTQAQLQLSQPVQSPPVDAALLAAHLGSFLDTTFGSLRHNVSINGVNGERVFPTTPSLLKPTSSVDAVEQEADASTHPEDYEDYDATLAARITTLHATVEKMNLALADTRRNAAARAADRWKRDFEERLRRDDEELVVLNKEEEEQEQPDLGLRGMLPFFGDAEGNEGRVEDVKRTWTGALDALARVQGGAEEVKKRAERARAVVAHLKG